MRQKMVSDYEGGMNRTPFIALGEKQVSFPLVRIPGWLYYSPSLLHHSSRKCPTPGQDAAI
ncbi:hypothetical protein KSF_011700 [Reticulibacter mediterranei]|uniref:Uncharacterized protein n=1 Tax=Reticulibacter mediterranei TaxID=2778369 RepID=A0A8J3IGL3_9CHLR|nr:hypothetical protein KSF_011700 [Reticulibacter mediterranei]